MTTNGLDDVTVAETCLSEIDGRAGRLSFRGYDAVELARGRTFEDVWALLVDGELVPNDAFAGRVASLRSSPLDRATLRGVAAAGSSPMASLQAAIAACGAAWGVKPWYGRNAFDSRDIGVRLASVVPTLVAELWRASRGEAPIEPDPLLGHAANFLWMLDGRSPSDDRALALERYLVLTAEHGLNASTFTARVIASTGADIVSAVAGAAGALSGPLHGGAPSLVLDMLDEVGAPERAEERVRAAIAGGRRLMGFGHRVYRAEDPRAACLRETAAELGGKRTILAREVERVALAELRRAKPDRPLFTNVEFWAAVVLERAGVPRPLFTPPFCISRTVGWVAHGLEQIADTRLIRPAATYVGPPVRPLAA